MLDNIDAYESKETGVLVIQLIEVRVFDGVNDLILECFIHCPHIIVDFLSFVLLKLKLVS